MHARTVRLGVVVLGTLGPLGSKAVGDIMGGACGAVNGDGLNGVE
jgi:hypothetical protein